MSRTKFSITVITFLIFTILLAACGGGAPPAMQAVEEKPSEPAAVKTEAPTQPPVETEAPAEPPTAEESGAISAISDAKAAVIQVEAQGSFVDPQVGQVWNSAGRGSGFIFDPSGLAVTNNHVVTGAALLKVWLGGDQSKTYNARVLGVSECSDLAVIDIEGDGFPFVSWYEGAIDVGQEIYVAGFPLGDPEYSLTKGIISKAKADGETSWASVDSVISYDATTNPGNSGGPVLTEDAQVVGVHYAGNGDTRQAFGISRDIALPVIEKLKQGDNLDSLGINGQAVSNEDGSLTGVWVSSVESGSPADKAGVMGGDIITTIENLVLATDGTMADYCDILRSHEPTDTLNLEIVRFATGEILTGQVNGRELEVAGTFDVGGEAATEEAGTTGGSPSGELNLNASASGDVIYSTEFDALLSDWVYFLMSGDESNVSAEIADSKLKIEIDARDTWYYLYLDAMTVDNVRLDTRVENLGVNNNNVSLFCRYSDDRGWYEFNIANNGEYNIYFYDAVNNRYNSLWSGGSTAIKMGKGVNEYTAICQGDSLGLWINGVEAKIIKNDRLTEGNVGLSLSSFNVTPVVAEFDYFVASVP